MKPLDDPRWLAMIAEDPDPERTERCVLPFNTESIGFPLGPAKHKPPMPPLGRNEVATLSALVQAVDTIRFDAIVLPPIVRGWRIEALVITARSLDLDAPLVDRMINGPAGESIVINLHGKVGQRYDLIARNVNAGDYDTSQPALNAADRKSHFRGVFWCRR